MDERVLRNELLARHTTFRIGGPADYYVRAETREELVEWVRRARDSGLPIFILGKGSNILVSDAGVRGWVIENRADKVDLREEGERLLVVAESGASLPGLANRLARQGWSGLEWAIGIPGSVGGAVVTNAGAHGGAIAESLTRAEILDELDTIRWWQNQELEFEYRSSAIKKRPGKYIVLAAEFQLTRDDPERCIARMSQYSEHRRKTQPTEPSVGSMFKNPAGDYAGRLIDAAGLKGTRVGQVEVSTVHANFFINRGGAAASDVMTLVGIVRERVREQFGVTLELEIQPVGEWR